MGKLNNTLIIYIDGDNGTSPDVGVDTRTPVDFSYDVPFRFTGAIDKLTFNLGPEQLSVAEKQAAAKAIAVAKD